MTSSFSLSCVSLLANFWAHRFSHMWDDFWVPSPRSWKLLVDIKGVGSWQWECLRWFYTPTLLWQLHAQFIQPSLGAVSPTCGPSSHSLFWTSSQLLSVGPKQCTSVLFVSFSISLSPWLLREWGKASATLQATPNPKHITKAVTGEEILAYVLRSSYEPKGKGLYA